MNTRSRNTLDFSGSGIVQKKTISVKVITAFFLISTYQTLNFYNFTLYFSHLNIFPISYTAINMPAEGVYRIHCLHRMHCLQCRYPSVHNYENSRILY